MKIKWTKKDNYGISGSEHTDQYVGSEHNDQYVGSEHND